MSNQMDPTVPVRVGEIRVKPGEILTVWLTGQNGDIYQIEIRSIGEPGGHTGKPEIFTGTLLTPGVPVYNFASWTTMEDAVKASKCK